MNIKENSWHHQLYTLGDRNKDGSGSNVCKYIRGVLAGIFLSLFLILISTIISVVLLDPILSVLAYWITNISYISFFGFVFSTSITLFIGYAIYIIIGTGMLEFSLYTAYTYIKVKTTPIYEDSTLNTFTDVVVAKIKSKHDKICRNINFIG